jgi:DNA mismatch repair protein MutS
MCGVPYHALDAYLAKLIRAGKTAALCEQVEDPKTVKAGQIVRREVTRIITPGTVTEDGLLDDFSNNYIASVCEKGMALLDLSTGAFLVEEFKCEEDLRRSLERDAPVEILMPRPDTEDPAAVDIAAREKGITYTDAWTFSLDAAQEELIRHFKVTSLDGFGIQSKNDIIRAAGALLYYVHVTLRHQVTHIRSLRLRDSSGALALDVSTLRHLAILPVDGVNKEATLLGVLNSTRTPMGARTLTHWLRSPLAQAEEINARLDAVETFVKERALLSKIENSLSGVKDLERLIARIDSGRANARDVKALAQSLRPIPELKEKIPLECSVLEDISLRITSEVQIVDLIDRAICEQPNIILTEGNLIAPGFNAELDELRSIATEGNRWLAEYQASEQERTGIKTLRVRRNGVFGFYIEISKAAASSAPPEYQRRQTLVNAERFTTPELKELEQKVLGAQEKMYALEASLFKEVVEQVALRTQAVQRTATAIGELDVLRAFADRALALGYVRPRVDESDILEIENGRHPIIEQLPDAEPFVPNSARLNGSTEQIMLITGPNMAGKSTYIRQVATIAIMAQAGSFVPADSVRMGVLDRVFTRIGAGDDLARGRSTFLVEMQETANILNNATPRSLIVLDEIGRGTSTFDGISIAWSVAEYLHENPKVKAKTLFATHYHELTDLADRFIGVKNWTVRVKQDGERIVFLRRIAPGVAEKSFGIHVAAMAGLPKAVVARADSILKDLEANELDVNSPKLVRKPRQKLSDLPGQMTLFD